MTIDIDSIYKEIKTKDLTQEQLNKYTTDLNSHFDILNEEIEQLKSSLANDNSLAAVTAEIQKKYKKYLDEQETNLKEQKQELLNSIISENEKKIKKGSINDPTSDNAYEIYRTLKLASITATVGTSIFLVFSGISLFLAPPSLIVTLPLTLVALGINLGLEVYIKKIYDKIKKFHESQSEEIKIFDESINQIQKLKISVDELKSLEYFLNHTNESESQLSANQQTKWTFEYFLQEPANQTIFNNEEKQFLENIQKLRKLNKELTKTTEILETCSKYPQNLRQIKFNEIAEFLMDPILTDPLVSTQDDNPIIYMNGRLYQKQSIVKFKSTPEDPEKREDPFSRLLVTTEPFEQKNPTLHFIISQLCEFNKILELQNKEPNRSSYKIDDISQDCENYREILGNIIKLAIINIIISQPTLLESQRPQNIQEFFEIQMKQLNEQSTNDDTKIFQDNFTQFLQEILKDELTAPLNLPVTLNELKDYKQKYKKDLTSKILTKFTATEIVNDQILKLLNNVPKTLVQPRTENTFQHPAHSTTTRSSPPTR